MEHLIRFLDDAEDAFVAAVFALQRAIGSVPQAVRSICRRLIALRASAAARPARTRRPHASAAG